MRLALLSTAAMLAASVPAAAQPADFSKVEVKAEIVAPGVAVLFGAGGNIGVSYGEDGTALVDDQYAPMTEKVVAAVAALGAKPVKFLINTHWHGDHSGGNENFGKAGAIIMAHDNVRVRLAQGGTSGVGTSGARDIVAAPSLALPVVTYYQGLKLHLNGDVIEAIFTGGGHTDGDTALYWRKANVLHTGDLMMNGLGFPFIDTTSGGNASRLVGTLTKLIGLTNAETRIIPGHGPVGKQADLIAWRDMIARSVELIGQRKAQGQQLEAVLADNPLKPMEQPKAFINADTFAKAIWAGLDAKPAPAHKHH